MRSTSPSSGGDVLPREQREERRAARPEARSTTALGATSSNSSPPATGSPSASPSHSPCGSRARSARRRARRRVTSPVATAARLRAMSAAFSAAVRDAVERDHRGEACGDRVGRDDLDADASDVLGRVLGGEHDVRVVRQEDRLVRRERLDRGQRARPSTGSSVCPPSTIAIARPARERLEQAPVPLARDDRHDAALHGSAGDRDGGAAAPRAAPSGRACSRSRRRRSCPTAVPSESATPGSSVWTCTLSAVSSPTTSE